jgi:hypothetical protein
MRKAEKEGTFLDRIVWVFLFMKVSQASDCWAVSVSASSSPALKYANHLHIARFSIQKHLPVWQQFGENFWVDELSYGQHLLAINGRRENLSFEFTNRE